MAYGHMISDTVEANLRMRRSRAASTPSPRTFNTARSDESRRDGLVVYKLHVRSRYVENVPSYRIPSALPYSNPENAAYSRT